MRHEISKGSLSEENVQPAELVKRFLDLTARDVVGLLRGGPSGASLCPGCESTQSEETFVRLGFSYRECQECFSLWIDPMPSQESILQYYRESDAEKYWQEVLAKETAGIRMEKIIRPRLNWVRDAVAEFRFTYPLVGFLYERQKEEIGTALNGLGENFCNYSFVSTLAEDEALALDFCEGSRVGEFDVVVGFEVLNRLPDPERFIAAAWKALKPGGLCFLTLTLSTGFDVMILGDRIKRIMPPDFLTVLSLEGVETLCVRNGFECLELSTPGLLDVEHVEGWIEKGEGLESIPKFVRYLLTKRGEATRRRLQDFLQEEQLSSHAKVLLRKPR